MSIRYKLLLPALVAFVLLGTTAYLVMDHLLDTMLFETSEKLIQNKEEEINLGAKTLSSKATQTAAIFSRMPDVVRAYETALAGAIDTEESSSAARARDMLRQSLASVVQGVAAAGSGALDLHFHLPNSRSLVRMWRDKQVQRNGEWIDVSDDLSSFRSTVLEVNRTKKPVSGIELGRGGFVLRGLVPVQAPDGRHLGSVEVLTDFNQMLKSKAQQEEENLLLFMNAELLSLATGLQDTAKHPVLFGRYVLVFDSSNGSIGPLLSDELLHEGRQGISRLNHGDMVLAAFPVKDYRGEQVGVVVYTRDLSSEKSYVRMVGITLGGLILLIMAVFIGLSFYVLFKTVFRPVKSIVHKIKDIAEDKANLQDRLDYMANDEMGELCHWFNKLMGKIGSLINLSQNVLDAIPDPVFAVDKDFRIVLANEAVTEFTGTTRDAIKGRQCGDVFKTGVCGTDICPVQQVMRDASKARSNFEFVHDTKAGEDWYIQPHVAEILDNDGNVSGYVEMIRNVTSHVKSEEAIQGNLECVQQINERLHETAERIVALADEVSRQALEVREGAETQRSSMAETASAMESMNTTILEVAKNASQAAQHNDLTREKAQEGAGVVERSIATIAKVHEQTAQLKTNLAQLGQEAESIGTIMNVISDIADQTNLLALNAAIEAARAGEAGRGFAVVADEVRKLAEKTMGATKEVGQAITSIQNNARVNMNSMENAAKAVDEAMNMADASGQALREILHLVERSSDQVRSIATASEEQSSASEQIAASMESVSQISVRTAEDMSTQVEILSQLATLTQELQNITIEETEHQTTLSRQMS